MNTADHQMTAEHYAWAAYESAFFAYGIDDDRTWAALEAWTSSLAVTS